MKKIFNKIPIQYKAFVVNSIPYKLKGVRKSVKKLLGISDIPIKPQDLPYEPKPFNCPICSSKITKNNDTYFCVGLKNREEVEKYLAPEFPKNRVPKEVFKAPSCGWSGAEKDFKKTWI